MKKLKYLLLLILLLPLNVKAFYFKAEDNIKENNEINESSLRVGNEIEVAGNVNGINIILGNNANIEGFSDYLFSIGNNINITGEIKNDGLILGNDIKINDFKSNRDIAVLGNNIEISGDVSGNLLILGSNIKLSGNFNNVIVKGYNININGKIKNNLEYNEDAKITISNKDDISNIIVTNKIVKNISFKDKLINFISDWCGTLFIFLALCLILPKLFNNISESNKKLTILDLFSYFGFGTLSMILFPVISILLISLIFGIQLAFLLLIVYFLFIWLSSIFTGFLIGNIIWDKFINKNKNLLLVGLIGISLLKLLCFIPIIGSLFRTVSIMIGMGIILNQFKRD